MAEIPIHDVAREATATAAAASRTALEQLQTRLGTLEANARERLGRALGAGNGALRELDEALARVSSEDWTVEGVRRRLGLLRARAENLRAAALRRVAELPGSAVSALASGSRAPVQGLARELDRLAKRLERNGATKA
ncbi:hypothetical protein [Anaeromyxobacter oryzisoli]|uniref:hypothetical protein n=1 Tax=Anaeromyxobacter oryzisoli TaxID=2925408 RepID=UPI001F560981|nr:hypothetical protein [Anaeromyxobacter sp. SG63]